ncbi:hypothetical protein [Burkholderia gladioli]|uniref:hypothetical protein n=1 Tax=Burkholderia gladioli TaxID=28095 RepID=UPI000627335F|nr:hypothetical protein [Burkholderia gladioli]KKJ04613.1 hypothetical protein XF14_21565 [Burkholderia gladioli]
MKRLLTSLAQVLATLALSLAASRWLYNSPRLAPLYDDASVRRFFDWLFRLTGATNCESQDNVLILFLLTISLIVSAMIVIVISRLVATPTK